MSKVIMLALAVLVLSGCDKPERKPSYIQDQDLRREIFKECLESVPKGPESTVTNDWAEVVENCGDQANRLSKITVDGYVTYEGSKQVRKTKG